MAKRSSNRQAAISLRQILPRAEFILTDDLTTSDCCAQVRDCQRGAILFLSRDSDDNQQQAEIALERGAVAIVCEQLLALPGVAQCIVPDARVAYGLCSQALSQAASQQLTKIAVTGSLGKTCATWLTASVLGQSQPTGFFSSLGRSLSTDFLPASDPHDFTRDYSLWLRDCAKAGAKHAVVEVHAQDILQHQLSGCLFDTAILTNLVRAHTLDQASWTNQREALVSIVKHLQPGGSLVINHDDLLSRELLRELSLPVLTVGVNPGSDLTAQLLERSTSEQTFLLTAGPESVAVRTQYVGDWFLQQALLAGAVGLLHGLSLTQIARGLESVDKLPGRFERIECGQDFAVFVDAAASATALSAMLETARELTTGRVISVCGLPADASEDELQQLGQTLEAQTDEAILTHDSGTCDEAEQLVSQVLAGYDSLDHVAQQLDRKAAIELALSTAQAGDLILISGARNRIFPGFSLSDDDRDIAETWLRNKFGQRSAAPKKRSA